MGMFAVTVLYYPEYIIKSFAFGQALSSTCYVVVHWIFFWNQFRQKAELMKNREQHKDNPLLALPFNSLRDFLPRKIEGKVNQTVVVILHLIINLTNSRCFCFLNRVLLNVI